MWVDGGHGIVDEKSLFFVSPPIRCYMSLNMLIKIHSMVNERECGVMGWKIN